MKTDDAKTLIEQQIEVLGTALEAGHSQQLQGFWESWHGSTSKA